MRPITQAAGGFKITEAIMTEVVHKEIEMDKENYYLRLGKHGIYIVPDSKEHGGHLGTLLDMVKKSSTDSVTTIIWPTNVVSNDHVFREELKDLRRCSALWEDLKKKGEIGRHQRCTAWNAIR